MNLTLRAPAKINLTLEVLSRRDDGFHELRSVIQTIDLCDSIVFRNSDTTAYRSASAGWDGEKSLVSKAVRLFRETTGCTEGVSISVEKRIPMMAGLGGDSSDAATVLKGLNRLWDAGLSIEQLHGMAEKLGSDVPFFLYGGSALLEGRGEIVIPLPPVRSLWAVLMIPRIDVSPGKTAKLFSNLTPEHYTDGMITHKLIGEINKGGKDIQVHNTFEDIAYDIFPGLGENKARFEELSGREVHLAGSGPVLFTLLKDRFEAEEIYNGLRQNRIDAVLSRTLETVEAAD